MDWEGLATRDHYISYILFIRALSTALHQEGLLLSIAIHPKQYFPKEVYENVDRVNLMTYDMMTMDDSHHASYDKGEVDGTTKMASFLFKMNEITNIV